MKFGMNVVFKEIFNPIIFTLSRKLTRFRSDSLEESTAWGKPGRKYSNTVRSNESWSMYLHWMDELS